MAKYKLGATEVVHVINDFLFMAHSAGKCEHELCHQFGVLLAPGKTVGPSSSITFLGIILDAVRMEARLPDDKLLKARALLLEFTRKQVTLNELQSLIGVLNFACSVVVPGRAFLRRLIDLTMGCYKPHHHIRLTQAKLDLGVWLDFLTHFNGRSFFLDEHFLTGAYLHLYTDAAGSIGYRAICGPEWFYGVWPVEWRCYNVAVLELYPIMVAVHVWGSVWANQSMFLH